MSRVAATLHASHLPDAGVSCLVHFAGDVLVVEGPETFRVPAASLLLSTGGFHDDTLFVNWEATAALYSVVIADPAAQKDLAASAPATLSAAFHRKRGELDYHRNKWRVVLGILGTVCLGLLVAWWQSEAIIGWLASKVPIEREERLGAMGLAQLKVASKLQHGGPAAQAVTEIGSRLTQGSRYKYQWLVQEDTTINAFSLPGGIVVINTGLIAATEKPEELAGVLAHEVQHVEGRHALEQMIHSAGWAGILAATLGDVSALTGVLIHQAGSLRHSRQLELEADAEGVKNLARAGIATTGVAQFFSRMAAEQTRTGRESVIALLSTHPATGDRLQRAEALAKAIPCGCQPLVYDWSAVREAARQATDRGEPPK